MGAMNRTRRNGSETKCLNHDSCGRNDESRTTKTEIHRKPAASYSNARYKSLGIDVDAFCGGEFGEGGHADKGAGERD